MTDSTLLKYLSLENRRFVLSFTEFRSLSEQFNQNAALFLVQFLHYVFTDLGPAKVFYGSEKKDFKLVLKTISRIFKIKKMKEPEHYSHLVLLTPKKENEDTIATFNLAVDSIRSYLEIGSDFLNSLEADLNKRIESILAA